MSFLFLYKSFANANCFCNLHNVNCLLKFVFYPVNLKVYPDNPIIRSKMKIRLLVLILPFLFSMVSENSYADAPKVKEGILDLRNENITDKFIITLNGDWEFYWMKKLYPNDFKKGDMHVPDLYGKVPSYWTDYSGKDFKTTKWGYATYRVVILLPPNTRKRFGFQVPVFDSAFDMWINGTISHSNGIPGKSESETTPGYKPSLLVYTNTSDTIDIIINVSNFHHRRGGFWMPMTFGSFRIVQKSIANKWAGDYATTGILFGFALFFFIFFILYPKDRIMGFFCLALFGMSLRPLFTSSFLIYDFYTISWLWTVKLEYLSLYLLMFGWSWFVDHLYPSKFIRYVTIAVTVVFMVAFFTTLFSSVKVFSYSMVIYYPSMIIYISYAIIMSFTGIIRKNRIDIVYFGAFILLTFGTLHDIVVSLGKSNTPIGYILSFVVVVFIFIQAVLLLYKWIKSFYEKERLQVQLEFLNRNLEEMISNRTKELQLRTAEIEKQNVRIALQNKQLSETIQLKNKIFSVISHDLRSPVVNILYMLNLLKEKEYKEKYDTFANSSIQYAQMVINLLENMLVWGRGQEEKIKYAPEAYDLSSIILTNMSIYKESSDRKEISVNFTQKGNSFAYFDKDLIDIVIRNLLSNAVKYTNRGGRISILVKDNSNEGEGIMIKICDNGIGIPEARQGYLFTSAEMKSTPGTENEKGTGLGLKLCYELISINKGTLSVESKEGEGSCFLITLPKEAEPSKE
jgi:signal transduction histidine kinase